MGRFRKIVEDTAREREGSSPRWTEKCAQAFRLLVFKRSLHGHRATIADFHRSSHIFDVVALRRREACVAQQTLRGLTGISLEASPLVVLSIPIRTSICLKHPRAPQDCLSHWITGTASMLGGLSKSHGLASSPDVSGERRSGTVAHGAQRLDEQAGDRVVLLCVRIK